MTTQQAIEKLNGIPIIVVNDDAADELHTTLRELHESRIAPYDDDGSPKAILHRDCRIRPCYLKDGTLIPYQAAIQIEWQPGKWLTLYIFYSVWREWEKVVGDAKRNIDSRLDGAK